MNGWMIKCYTIQLKPILKSNKPLKYSRTSALSISMVQKWYQKDKWSETEFLWSGYWHSNRAGTSCLREHFYMKTISPCERSRFYVVNAAKIYEIDYELLLQSALIESLQLFSGSRFEIYGWWEIWVKLRHHHWNEYMF